MPEPVLTLNARRLEAWAQALDERETGLIADRTKLEADRDELAADRYALKLDQDAFDKHIAAFEKRAERFAETATETLDDALTMIQKVFPGGVTIEPVADRRDGSVH